MSTPSQIAANRKNSQKSTGPRSAQGKAASRANSLKTGLYARSQIIAGEDPAELRALADNYFLRWEPAAPEESFLVATLVDSDWLLRRYSLADAQIWDYQGADDSVRDNPNGMGLNFIRCREYFPLLQRRIDSAQRSFHRALHDLERLQTKRRAAPQSTAEPVTDPPPEAKANSAQPQSAPQKIGFVPSFSPAPDSASPKPVQAAVPKAVTHLTGGRTVGAASLCFIIVFTMRVLTGCAASVALLIPLLLAQTPQPPQPPKEPTEKEKEEIDSGIPISSELVKKSCSPCHKVDEKGRLSRISWRRTTPEGWELTIKRMVSLNGLEIQPADAREVLKYLSTNLGLAPEEARAAAFEAEKRMIDYQYSDKDVEGVCSKCHSMGRVVSQRRSEGEWKLLIAMHRGYYPLSDFQAFRRGGPPQTQPGPDGRPPDNRHPMDKVIPKLAEQLALKTPEWSAWAANMRVPKLQGRWAFSGYQAGRGPIYGETTIKPTGKEDEFQTETRYVVVKSGETVRRTGKALVYTGFQWRGRSYAGSADTTGMREVMLLDRNQRELTGRWFTGGYDEIGINVTLTRLGNDPVVLGLDQTALQTGVVSDVAIHGANFPAGVIASAIDFGRGVSVKRVMSATPELVRVEVEVAKDATLGPRDVAVSGAYRTGAAMIYDKIDAIKVLPQAGMARAGGINFPKQFQQFEAIAYHNGADGKPDTKDDLTLGPVNVTWSVEEYPATFEDHDKDYVGTLDANGLFTPNVDGPNPNRPRNANNTGDVWVVATYKTPEGKTLRARALLIVTVPLYVRYDQPEVAQ